MLLRPFFSAPLALAVLWASGAYAPASAQRLLDWPVRTDALPDALIPGAAAIFWNPARTGAHSAARQLLVVDLGTPDALALDAVALAGAVRVLDVVTLTAGYQHASVGDMTRTSGPPTQDPGVEFEVGEDLFALGVAATTERGWTLGSAARFIRRSEELGGGETLQGALGLGYEAALRSADLTLSASGTIQSERFEVAGAVDVRPHLPSDFPAAMALSWGMAERQGLGIAQQWTARGTWRGLAELQLGLAGEPAADEHSWQPLLAALLHLGRYTVGVVREQLPNDFGSVYHYRLSIQF